MDSRSSESRATSSSIGRPARSDTAASRIVSTRQAFARTTSTGTRSPTAGSRTPLRNALLVVANGAPRYDAVHRTNGSTHRNVQPPVVNVSDVEPGSTAQSTNNRPSGAAIAKLTRRVAQSGHDWPGTPPACTWQFKRPSQSCPRRSTIRSQTMLLSHACPVVAVAAVIGEPVELLAQEPVDHERNKASV
jgi:hypothetical protein